MTKHQRKNIARQIYPALVALVQNKSTGTYVAWFKQQTNGLVSNRNQISAILDVPERYFLARNEPDLTVSIVRKDTRLPGKDFWKANGQSPSQTSWTIMMNQASVFVWPTACPY